MDQSASGLRLLFDEPMRRHTSLGVGGPADVFTAVSSLEMLVEAVKYAAARGLRYRVIGSGTNLLVHDTGFRGMIIHNAITGLNPFGEDDDSFGALTSRPLLTSTCSGVILISVSSGVSLAGLARSSVERGLGGLEWAADIPGTVGGAVAGNAGAFGYDIARSLLAVEVLDEEGKLTTIPASALEFGYRSSPWRRQGAAARPITGVQVLLQPEDRGELESRVVSQRLDRNKRQPKGRSAGSVFRNPEGDSAGRLIEQVGLKGSRVGGAVISDLHANFILNDGNATASDIFSLISLCRDRVRNECGVELELELVVLGEE